MKMKGRRLWKRIIAILLVLSIVLADSNIWSITAIATNTQGTVDDEGETTDEGDEITDENVTVPYQLGCVVSTVNGNANVSDATFVIKDSTSTIVNPTNNVYSLVVGKKYTYEITSSKLKETLTGEIDAVALDENESIKIHNVIVPHDKLKIEMQPVVCDRGSTIDLLENDWNLGWKWTIEDNTIVSIDGDGKLKGLKVGSTKITKTHKTIPEITASTTITVQPLQVNCKLDFVVQTKNGKVSVGESYQTCELKKDNGVINPTEGVYSLIEGETYTYRLYNTYGVESGETGSFVAPNKTNRDTETVKITLDIAKPVVKVGDMRMDDELKLKVGSKIKISVDGSKVFDIDNWCYKITYKQKNEETQQMETVTDELKLSESKDNFVCESNVTIQTVYCNQVMDTYEIKTVDNYIVKAMYGTTEIKGLTLTFKENGEPVNETDIEPNVTYHLTYSGNGVRGESPEFSFDGTSAEVIIDLSSTDDIEDDEMAGDFIRPTLSFKDEGVTELKDFCGGSIDLTEVLNISEYCSVIGWTWKCVSEDGKSLEIDKKDNILKLGEQPGTYYLTYESGDITSYNRIKVVVQKTELVVNWDDFAGDSKYYDGTKKFQIEMNIADTVAVDVYEEEKSAYSFPEKDTLVIKGTIVGEDDTLDGSNVGNYRILNIEDVSVKNEEDSSVDKRYDLSKIATGEVDIGVISEEKPIGKYEIKQLEVNVTIENENGIILNYRVNTINYQSNRRNVQFDIDDLGNIDDIQTFLYTKMQPEGSTNTVYIGEDIKKVSFPGVGYNASTKKAFIYDGADADTSNAIIYFSDGEYADYDNNKSQEVWFDFSYTSEDIQNIPTTAFSLSQDVDGNGDFEANELVSGSWCNGEAITGKVLAPYQADDEGEGYNAVRFADVGSSIPDNMQEAVGRAGRTTELNPNGNGVHYYAIVFARYSEVEGDYPGQISDRWDYETGVALIRVIPEDKVEDGEYPTTVENFPYPIINLYYDNSRAILSFEDAELNREPDKVKYTYKAKGNIVVDVTNTGFPIASVKYKFVNISDVRSWEDNGEYSWINQVKYKASFVDWSPTTPDMKKGDDYVIPCPEENDGDYVIFVEAQTEGALTSLAISNAFVVDNKPPIVFADFQDKEGKNYKEDILANKKPYVKSKQLTTTFQIQDTSLVSCTVSVTIEDSQGNVASLDDLAKEIQEGIMSNQDHTFQKTLTDPGIYTIKINATDTANNEAISELDAEATDFSKVAKGVTYQFILDSDVPKAGVKVFGTLATLSDKDKRTGDISVIEKTSDSIREFYNKIVNAVNEGIYGKDVTKYTLTAWDDISGCKQASYYVTSEELTEADLKALDDKSWIDYETINKKGEIEFTYSLVVNKSQSIYQRVEDKAGNVSYSGMQGLITDIVAPKVAIEPTIEKNENGFYNQTVPFEVVVKDEVLEGAQASSGLQYVSCRIEADGEVEILESYIYDNRDKEPGKVKKEHKIPGKINAKTFNNNEVKVSVTAIDNAGNKTPIKEAEKVFKIDTTQPVIKVDFDDAEGAEYYNHTRTATVTITERNLDTKNDVQIVTKSKHGSKPEISGWTSKENTENPDATTHTCKLTFAADDDYEFYVDCVDKAGNDAIGENGKDIDPKDAHVFTVDKTIPTISVSYSGGEVEENGYYNSAVTATITIAEHNFDASKADVTINGPAGTRIGSSSFSDNGDVHTASVVFNQDGAYSLDVAVTDEAGNEAQSYSGNTFNVDLKEPEIVISNVKDKSANKDEVKPIITCTDENYDKDKVTITVTGANSGKIDLSKLNMEKKAIANGEEFYLTFPKEEVMDDIYTLTAKLYDKANNEKEESIQFSVNRYGSVYTLGTETGEWLTNGVCSYIQEGKPVVIIETNVDEVVERNISYTAGSISAETVAVNEYTECSSEEKANGAYFQSKKVSSGNDWYQYQYTIHEDNFTKEGHYSIQIDSKDKAGNHASNVSNKHSDSNLEILFAVDQTAPSAVVSGTENGGIYQEEKRVVMLDVQDNLALCDVTVYLNGDTYATYDSKALSELSDGLIPVEVKESFTTQTIQLKATDMAGNVLGENVNGTYDKTFEDFNLIVTQNIVIQMLYKYWLYIVIGVGALIGIILLIVFKRKKR